MARESIETWNTRRRRKKPEKKADSPPADTPHPTMAVVDEVLQELSRQQADQPPYASAHEGYAFALEELDELWDETRRKVAKHDYDAMRKEAVQLAARAIRFVLEVCDPNKET